MFSNSKRCLSLLLACLLLLGGTSLALDTNSDLSGYVGTGSGFPGETVSIPVGMNAHNTFASFSGTVTYDATLLTPTDVTANVAGDFQADWTTTPGTISVAYTADDPSVGIDGFGRLFTTSFELLTNDTGYDQNTHVLANLTVKDLDGTEYAASISNGSVTVKKPDTGVYKINFSTNNNQGGYASATVYESAAGETIQLNAAPKSGYRFDGWSAPGVSFSDSTSPDATFVMPAKDVTITASFSRITSATRFNIKFATVTGGSANARVFAESTTTLQSSAKAESLVTLTAIPDAGYYLKSWDVSDSDGHRTAALRNSIGAMATFYMPEKNVFVTPTFEKVPDGEYSVTVYSEGHGAAHALKYTYAAGDSVSLSAAPDDDYEFTAWSCDSTSVSFNDVNVTSTTFVMPAENVVVTARFTEGEDKYSVGFQTLNGGKAMTENGKTKFYPGSTVTIVAVADADYRFYEWTASTSSGVKFKNKSSYITSFTMPTKDVVITAAFVKIKDGTSTDTNTNTNTGINVPAGYCSVVFDSQGGSTVPSATVVTGATVSAPALPTKSGFVFGGWYTDSTCTNAYNFSSPVTSNLILYARWTTGGLFKDVPSDAWFAAPVNSLAARSIIKGVGNDLFAPNATITRAQFAQLLANLAGIDPLAFATNKFTDVPATAWYYGAVSWAASLGIVNGTASDRFSPDAPITRQDIAVMLVRYVNMVEGRTLAPTVAEITFADHADISRYAEESVMTMQRANIISGKGNNRFDPKASATRAEASKMIYSLLQVLGK